MEQKKKKFKGPCCVAWKCTGRQGKRSAMDTSDRNQDITFHRFPSNFELCDEWVKAIRREDFKPTKSSRICSKHFKPTDFTASQKRRRLKEFAIPSIFDFTPHLNDKRKSLKKRLIQHSLEQRQPPSPTEYRSDLFKLDHPYTCSTHKEDAGPRSRLWMLMLRKRLKNIYGNRTNKNKRLKKVITDLRSMHLIDSDAHAILEESFSWMSLDLFRRIKSSRKGKWPNFLPKVRDFAVSLYFLSPKAYEFVRNTLHLPQPHYLRRWKASTQCSPGYLDNMLKVASVKARQTKSHLCSLIVDEIGLRRDVTWVSNQNRYCGFIDVGHGSVGSEVATKALLFMLVSLTGTWKAPIAYFLIDHISSSQLAASVKEAILKAADYGLIVKTFVADGLKTSMGAARDLGCTFGVQNLCTHFTHPHPKHSHENIYFVCDPSHTLKLFRNCIAQRGIIKRQTLWEEKTISWKYIKALYDFQKTESLDLANKLTEKHIQYENVRLKEVNIVAQTLSNSVAKDIDHLRDDLKIVQFQGSEETCHFLRQLDRLFDILNSKNPFARGQKAALSLRNMDTWKPFLQCVIGYLISLREPSGVRIYLGGGNLCVRGFIIAALSTFNLATELLAKGNHPHLLTYKFSQDHVKMFFRTIRQRSDWNKKPTSEEFRDALKTMMLSNVIRPSTSKRGKAKPLADTMELVMCSSSTTDSDTQPSAASGLRNSIEYMAAISQLESPLMNDPDWRRSCLLYTAGFVAKRVDGLLTCRRCSNALIDSYCTSRHDNKFLREGGHKIPSKGVLDILTTSERVFRTIIPCPALMDVLLFPRFVDKHMQTMVLASLQSRPGCPFPSLTDHFFDHEMGLETDHISNLIKTIAGVYFKMRLLKARELFLQRQMLTGRTSTKRTKSKPILFSGL